MAMVFQNYALYPHMSVRQNIAFALRVRKFPQPEIDERVNEAARILDLGQLLDRKPKQLSGGQRQRVAMGRAIVRHPGAFLLDEPLSNLDAKLRVQLRARAAAPARAARRDHDSCHPRPGRGDDAGRPASPYSRTARCSSTTRPQALYRRPANIFVAGFIGSPAMNFMEATLARSGAESTAVGGGHPSSCWDRRRWPRTPWMRRTARRFSWVSGPSTSAGATRRKALPPALQARVELSELIEPEAHVSVSLVDPGNRRSDGRRIRRRHPRRGGHAGRRRWPLPDAACAGRSGSRARAASSTSSRTRTAVCLFDIASGNSL